MLVNLDKKTFLILGYKGSGKSTLAKTIATSYGARCLYYDTLHEIPESAKFHAYRPVDRQSVTELEKTVKFLEISKAYRLFLIDESNRYFPPKPSRLPQGIADLNDWCRHPQYNLGVGYIARRPVQINTDLVEICDYMFIFQLGGKNDVAYLNSLRDGLGDTVKDLKPYHFVLANQDRTFKVYPPVNPPPDILNSDTKKHTGGKY